MIEPLEDVDHFFGSHSRVIIRERRDPGSTVGLVPERPVQEPVAFVFEEGFEGEIDRAWDVGAAFSEQAA